MWLGPVVDLNRLILPVFLYREGWLSWLVRSRFWLLRGVTAGSIPSTTISKMILSPHGGMNIVSSNTMHLHFTLFYNFS